MRLNQLVFKVPEPVNAVMENEVMPCLRAVQDDAHQDLNLSVEFGIDSALWDVMAGGVNSGPDQFPMIRIYYGNFSRETDDGLMGITGTTVPIQFYFLYYVGIPSTDPVQTSFVTERENHIRYCLEALRMDRLVPSNDAQGYEIWRWETEQVIVQDNDTPFRYLDSTFVLHRDFACTRVDINLWCRGSIFLPTNTDTMIFALQTNATPTTGNYYGLNADFAGGATSPIGLGAAMPLPGTFKNAYFTCSGSLTFINATWTLYKSTDGGRSFSATAISITATASYTASDLSHTVSANAGDSFIWLCDSSTAVQECSLTIEYDPN